MNESTEWILELNLSQQEELELREILDAFSDSKSRSEWEDISLKEQLAVFAFEHNLALSQFPSLQTLHASSSYSTLTDLTWNNGFSSEIIEESHTRKLGRFVDDSLLGIGGMGEVRKVLDPNLNCYLAMKIMHKRLMDDEVMTQRFHQEARIIASLQHPSIPPVHEIGNIEDGRPFFTMREIRGNSLANILRSKRENVENWNLRKLISIFQQVCSTIAFAHAQNIIHRDLKPANIMVGEFGEVLVVDWGLAKIIDTTENKSDSASVVSHPPSSLITMWGTVQGTPAYMSPEQAKGENLDERSDVYALGSILYEILSGRPPFIKDQNKKEQASDILAKVIHDTPPDIETHNTNSNMNLKNPIPSEMIDICKLSMIKTPSQRNRWKRNLREKKPVK